MVLFNYSTKEITAKVVYYGPGLCGKTTNLQFVYDALPSNSKSKMLSLATKADRTLFFDFLPLDLGKIRGMRTRIQLYTVPGQVYYNSTRQLVLKGADGVVFVADSQAGLIDADIESWNNLKDNLRKQGVDYRKLPVVMQYNKRDLPGVMPVDQIDRDLNELNSPFFESIATSGIGVEDTLKGIIRLVLKDLMGRYGLSGEFTDDEIVIGPKPGGTAKGEADGETVWAEDGAKGLDDVQEVPFLMPEATGAEARLAQQTDGIEVVALSAGTTHGFAEATVELLDSETPPYNVALPSAVDEDDIVFDTLPEGVTVPPRPLAADSLVVALGGAPEKKAPQTAASVTVFPPIAPAIPPAPPAAAPPAESAPPTPRPSAPAQPAGPPPAMVPSPPLVRPSQGPPAPPRPSPPSAETPHSVEPPAPRPSFRSPVPAPPQRPSMLGTPQDPGTLVKEVALPLNLTIDEVAGKRKIIVRIQLEVNILR